MATREEHASAWPPALRRCVVREDNNSMNRSGRGLATFALVLSGLALIISLVVYLSRPRVETAETRRAAPPTTVTLSMVVATFSGQGVFAHRWYPTMMIVREGDTVDLVVANPDEFAHQLELTGYDQKTPTLNPGESARIKFVADKVGVFGYHCSLPYDPAKKHCTPDHGEMRGYLIVTAR